MNVRSMIRALDLMDPDMDVRIWDTQRQSFVESFECTPSMFGDELLIVPIDPMIGMPEKKPDSHPPVPGA